MCLGSREPGFRVAQAELHKDRGYYGVITLHVSFRRILRGPSPFADRRHRRTNRAEATNIVPLLILLLTLLPLSCTELQMQPSV